MTGTITKFKREHGYLFVTNHEDGNDVFCHRNDCGGKQTTWMEGDVLEYAVENTPKGLRAKNPVLIQRRADAY